MTGLPPDGAVLSLERGVFRAIIVHAGPRDGTAELRGWYLDHERITEETITVELAAVSLLELG